MNCLWCRNPVRPRDGFASPDFCCQRCEYRFYATGHQLEQDKAHDAKLRAEMSELSAKRDEYQELVEAQRQLEASTAKLAQSAKRAAFACLFLLVMVLLAL